MQNELVARRREQNEEHSLLIKNKNKIKSKKKKETLNDKKKVWKFFKNFENAQKTINDSSLSCKNPKRFEDCLVSFRRWRIGLIYQKQLPVSPWKKSFARVSWRWGRRIAVLFMEINICVSCIHLKQSFLNNFTLLKKSSK